MPAIAPDAVYVRVKGTGHVHLAYRGRRRGDPLRVPEGCNLDDAGPREEITVAELADAEPGSLCERCFPPAEGASE